MRPNRLALAAWMWIAVPALGAEVGMVRLSGAPAEIGKTWGEINRQVIVHDLDANYLKKAAAAKLSEEALIERSEAFVRIVEQIAPHWLEEARAIARAAGVREDLYVAFIGGKPRNLFLHECTSYAVAHRGGPILFHKNRDNADRQQAAYVLESSLDGIRKFIAVCDANAIGCSMMVNDAGLAGAGDYPVERTRKNDPAALRPQPAEPRYRGLMGGLILRYIAERASDCGEALNIVEEFVEKGYYAGGEVNGQHWLFVDRHGAILEVSNNSKHVVSRTHAGSVYFSRFDDKPAARRLREAEQPIDFHLFHNASRDPSICLDTSISGMTVEIDPDHPAILTSAWVSLPARSVSFPLVMGQSRTPSCLLSGEAYVLGKQSGDKRQLWESVEQVVHAGKQRLKEEVLKSASTQGANGAAGLLDPWAQRQAETMLEFLRPGEQGKQPER